ncbi:porin [Rhodanobacter panaciterrae]|uniref:Porin n=2 Tax=Rhodanobacter panaciterrae TaxID=490572 RepID=A0ABQ2ZPI3_9GAMM|nr:porin [Rhodanobacter panaciterrae]
MRSHSIPQLHQTTRCLLFGTALLSVCPAMAQQATTDGWLGQPTMTGDWGGLRTELQNDGITLRAHWTTESAGNPSGGKYQTARYTQQFDLGADFDLDRLWGVPDAKIQFTLTDRSGRSLSADAIGNQFAVQELYGAGQNFRLAELNYQQDLLDHKVIIELGWSPLGDHFANLPAFCDFQNGVICGHANAMTVNSGAHNFPTAEWGARIEVRPTPGFYVATGIYQVNPNEGNADEGFNLSFKSTGAFIPVELGWMTGSGSGELPGNIKVGGYYNTSKAPDVLTDVNGLSAGLTDGSFEQHNGRSGGYVVANHMVYREGPDSACGLYFGAMAGVGDAATAKFRYFWMAGGHFQGTFPGRDDDVVAFMVAYARTNSRLTRYQEDRDSVTPGAVGIQTYESVAEIDYGARLTPWLVLRPNLQYVIHPGGTGKIPDAFVIGLYTQVTF